MTGQSASSMTILKKILPDSVPKKPNGVGILTASM